MSQLKINLSTLMGKQKIRSIHQLSRETKISRQVLTRLYQEDETYNPNTEILIRICDFFDCSLADLIEYDPRKGRAS